MQANKRTLSLLVVAIAIGALYFITTQLMAPEGEPSEQAETAQVEGGEAEEADGEEPEAEEPEEEGAAADLSEEERQALQRTVTIQGNKFEAVVDNLGGGLQHVFLTGDPRFTDEDGQPLDVITTNPDFPQYEALRVDLAEIGIPDDAIWELDQVSDDEVRLTWEGEGVRVIRTLLAGEGPYQLWSTTRVVNTAGYERTTRLEMASFHYVEREDESGGIIASRSPYISHGVCVFGDETERKDREKLVEEGVHGYGSGNVHISAVENVYFTVAMAAHETPAARCALGAEDIWVGGDDPHGSLFETRLIYPWTELDAGEEVTYQTLAYVGPKDRDALNLAGHHLPEMVDLGFFALIARQLARFLSFIHANLPGHNWGLAIILLTLIIRLTLFPLTNLSFKSMARMRQLKPQIDRLNELYKDDAEKKGAAIMELYRKNKINPLSGCLPSLLQLPVWWALYTSLSTNIELYHMPFTLWWTDLSSPDPFYVLPVMLGGLMHLQQRLSPTTMDPTQAKMMMYFMPIMITVFMLFLPSGLCLYMLTNSALGIGQQKLNEYRLAKEPGIETGDDSDDSGDEGAESEDDSPEKPQRRRPRRKRRVRRGRA